ncbi:MAG: hypothetical protein WC445_04830 [Patescibacteria group bacterium]
MRNETPEKRMMRLLKEEKKILKKNFKKMAQCHEHIISHLEKIVFALLKENEVLASKIKELESERR